MHRLDAGAGARLAACTFVAALLAQRRQWLTSERMGDVINLRKARKRNARAAADAGASRNRAAHGRTKAERQSNRANQEADERKLDGHRLDDDDGSK